MICGLTSTSIWSSSFLTCWGSTWASSFFTTNHATRFRSIAVAYLHTQASTFDNRGAAAHENVGHFDLVKGCVLLVIGIVGIPDDFGSFIGIVRCFGRSGEKHGPKDARTASRPPLRHLVDRFPRIAFDGGDVVDGQDGKIDFQARLGPVRVREIHRLQMEFFDQHLLPRRRLPSSSSFSCSSSPRFSLISRSPPSARALPAATGRHAATWGSPPHSSISADRERTDARRGPWLAEGQSAAPTSHR